MPGQNEPKPALRFRSKEDEMLALLFTARYLPKLVQRFEAGVQDLGFEILERIHCDDDGKTRFFLLLAHGANRVQVDLTNSFEDFLLADQEEALVRVDPRLRDQAYAEAKLADVVGGRLAILETLLECRSAREAQERLAALGDRFEWMRIVVEETSPG